MDGGTRGVRRHVIRALPGQATRDRLGGTDVCGGAAPVTALEVYGCYATPLDAVFWWEWPDDVMPYLISARCSTGCHVMQDVVDGRELGRLLPELEHMFRQAFLRKHSA